VKFHTLANHCMLGNLLRLKYLNGDNLENKRQSAGNQSLKASRIPQRLNVVLVVRLFCIYLPHFYELRSKINLYVIL
jgi:hypothetical protein